MRKLLLATVAVLPLALPTTASADLVLVGGTPALSFRDLGGVGFGNAPRLITEQTDTFESGSVTPVNQANGDAIANNGGNKSNTPTLFALGWTSGAEVGLGLNWDQTGQTGITLQSLTLTIYNGITPVASFPIAGPIQFSASDLDLEKGNGSSIFDFGLDAAQQVVFNGILAQPGSSGFFAGVSMDAGCAGTPSATCQVSNDGPDSVLGFAQSVAVPGPIAGAGLPGLVAACIGLLALARRRRRHEAVA